MPSPEQILAQLGERGYRDTASRRRIVEAVVRRGAAFTAHDIAEELSHQGVGRATVFRTLQLLHELGLLNRLHIGEGCHRYTVCDPHHHHHMVCLGCGSVYPLGECTIAQDVQQSARRLGFAIEGHHMEIFGRCADCATS